MKRKIVYFIAILLTFSPFILFAQTYEEELRQLSSRLCQSVQGANIRTIAVVDFTDLQGNVTELGRFIAEELSTNLVSTKRGFEVIDRLHIRSIIKEHKLSTSWFLDQKAVEKFGKISGVDAIVTGTVTPFGDSVRVSAKVIRTDTARVIAAASGNIAKTKAIEGLLARGIEVAGAPAAAPTRPKRVLKYGDLRIWVKSFKKSGNQIKVVLVYENTGKEGIKVCMARSYLLDENGERWDVRGHDTAGLRHGKTILGGQRLPTRLVFSATGNPNGKRFSLTLPHWRPRGFQAVFQDLVPE